MAEVVNLRRARKAKARATAEATAQTNRALHGRTKAQKLEEKRESSRLARIVDGAKLKD